jgi:hypothetical protein
MTHAELIRSVQAALASKRLGTPVFIRLLLHGGGNGVLARLTSATMTVRDWIGQPLERLYAVGRLKDAQVSLTLEFRGGATALVAHAAAPAPGGGSGAVDLTLLGNRGALYHDFGSTNLWESVEGAEAPAADKKLQALIERALESGQPETVAGGSSP